MMSDFNVSILKEKFNSDMNGVLIVQIIWIVLLLLIRDGNITSGLIIFLCIVLIYCALMHYIFTTLPVKDNFLKHLKIYLFSLQILNIIILLLYEVGTGKILTTVVIGFLVCLYTRKNIVKVIDLKEYDDNKAVHYFVILAGMLMATYSPLLMVCSVYILANMLLIYVHDKFAYLTKEKINYKSEDK